MSFPFHVHELDSKDVKRSRIKRLQNLNELLDMQDTPSKTLVCIKHAA